MYIVVHQKPTQHCKVIILQLKKNFKYFLTKARFTLAKFYMDELL